MKDIIRITIIGGTLLALVLLAAPQQASAGDKGYEELKQDLQTAKNDLSKAEAKAQENKPDDASKEKEDTLDKEARANDDTPGDPATNAAKKKSEDAENHAKTEADKAAKASKDPDKADAYRKALADRRTARKKLKKVIADLLDLKRRQRSLSDRDDVDTPIKEAREAQKKSESTISLGRTATGIGGGETCAVLISTGKIKVETSGTGETIGHIADLKIQNLTDQPLAFAIPPTILESGSGKNQHYACPKGQTVALNPRQEKTVPMDGVCVNRSKPPVGKGVTGDLVINEGNPTIPQNPNSHVPPKDANKLLRLCTSKYDAADKLQKDGQLKNLPYHDPQKQKDIVTQWSTWMDPQICQLLGTPPATQEDLKKVVYKQVPEPMTPATKKKIDQGIDTIFEKVELTTAKAKDLEKPDQYAQTEPPNSMFEVSDQQGKPAETPPPQTQEKPKEKTEEELRQSVQTKEERVANPDGSITTTTTKSYPSDTTTTSKTEYPDGTTSTTTVIKFKGGDTTTHVTNRDGSTLTTGNSTDNFQGKGRQTTTTSTMAKDGTITSSRTTVDKDGNKTSTTSTWKDGSWTETTDTTNADGSKETTTRKSDGTDTTTSTDKEGKTSTTSSDGNGHETGKTSKGSYKVDPQPDGSKLVHWDLPSGTGGSKTFPPGTQITPNTADGNPLPFSAGPAPPAPK